MPKTLALASLPAPPPDHRLESGEEGLGAREAAIGRVVGGAPREPGWGGRRGDDGGENPGGAGRARTSRTGCGGARGASSAEGGGWLAGTVTSRCRGRRREPHCPPHRGPRQAARPRRQRPQLWDRPRDPRGLWGPQTGSRAYSATVLCRQLGLALPASQGQCRNGVGATPESEDGPPPGHRAAPGGLTDREDRRRWVWAGRTAHWGCRGLCGGGEGERKTGLLWAVGSLGELLPTMRSGQPLTLTTPASSRSPAWMLSGCSSAPSTDYGDHGFADASLPISKPHGPPAGQL